MKWEVKKLPDGRWGIFLCEEFWKFPDKPVCYGASIVKKGAQYKVDRLNNPKYDFDANYITVKQARDRARKEKADAKAAAKKS